MYTNMIYVISPDRGRLTRHQQNYEFFMTTIKSMFTSVHRNIHLESKHLKYPAIYSTMCFKVFIKSTTSCIHYHIENITDVYLSTICLCQK